MQKKNILSPKVILLIGTLAFIHNTSWAKFAYKPQQDDDQTLSKSTPDSLPVNVTTLAQTEQFLIKSYDMKKHQAAEIAFKLSLLNAQQKNYAKAKTFIQNAIILQPINIDFYLTAADYSFHDGELKNADRYLSNALKINQKFELTSNDKQQSIQIMKNLSVIYMAQNRLNEAESIYRKKLSLQLELAGSNQLSVVSSYNDLSKILVRKNSHKKAEKLLTKALNIVQTNSPNNNEDLLSLTLHNLADLYRYQNRFNEADNLYQKTITLWNKKTLDQRVKIAKQLCNLGEQYLLQNQLNQVQPQFELVISLLKNKQKQDHLYVTRAKEGLAKLKQAQANKTSLIQNDL